MIDKLKQIEDKLILELLSNPKIWQSSVLDKQKPIVEKMWTQINKYIISLYFIHTCNKEEIRYKYNECPSAMHILQGSCEIGVGFKEVENITTMHIPQGNMYFDMTADETIYFIRSTNSVSSSVMLSGEKWKEVEIEDGKELRSLEYDRQSIMLEYFSNYYRGFYQNERVKDNMSIQKGDWVEFDINLMSEYDKKSYSAILNMRGFVIKATETLVDARFGNDRTQIRSCFLKKLYASDVQKPTESTKALSSQADEDDDDFDPDFL
jgi:hypothetical protein